MADSSILTDSLAAAAAAIDAVAAEELRWYAALAAAAVAQSLAEAQVTAATKRIHLIGMQIVPKERIQTRYLPEGI